ncbi:hypothetical protein FACS1894216_05290 [Synergistales bacterium]|nr:hypothetical protein FACS1894216_05290 [Synergistales bacterium]
MGIGISETVKPGMKPVTLTADADINIALGMDRGEPHTKPDAHNNRAPAIINDRNPNVMYFSVLTEL